MERMNKNCALPKACGKLVVELEIAQHLVLAEDHSSVTAAKS